MTFADQWANRHDGECEDIKCGLPGCDCALHTRACHCYRRWLEARLGEIGQREREAVEAVRRLIDRETALEALLRRAMTAEDPDEWLADAQRLLPLAGAGE